MSTYFTTNGCWSEINLRDYTGADPILIDEVARVPSTPPTNPNTIWPNMHILQTHFFRLRGGVDEQDSFALAVCCRNNNNNTSGIELTYIISKYTYIHCTSTSSNRLDKLYLSIGCNEYIVGSLCGVTCRMALQLNIKFIYQIS